MNCDTCGIEGHDSQGSKDLCLEAARAKIEKLEKEEPEKKWGVGDEADAKAFDHGELKGSRKYELITGQHPHSKSDNCHYARFENGKIEAFDGHRRQIKVEIETFNYMKQSHLSGSEIRKGGEGKIFFDGRQVTNFFFRDPLAALTEARDLVVKFKDHVIDWGRITEAELIGRKVYYKDVPAVILHWYPDQGCVVLGAEQGHGFPISSYTQE